MARISLDPPSTLLNRAASFATRRRTGSTLEPFLAAGHNRKVLLSYTLFELGVERWDACDPHLKMLAVLASAQRLGCSWCIDFGHWTAHGQGIDPAKIEAVPHWRASDAFTDTERMVLAYAEAMSGDIGVEVDDAQVAELEASLGTPALVELTMLIAAENLRSRFNSALGLRAQGFKDRCELPATP